MFVLSWSIPCQELNRGRLGVLICLVEHDSHDFRPIGKWPIPYTSILILRTPLFAMANVHFLVFLCYPSSSSSLKRVYEGWRFIRRSIAHRPPPMSMTICPSPFYCLFYKSTALFSSHGSLPFRHGTSSPFTLVSLHPLSIFAFLIH